jgi:hypothetical protein
MTAEKKIQKADSLFINALNIIGCLPPLPNCPGAGRRASLQLIQCEM